MATEMQSQIVDINFEELLARVENDRELMQDLLDMFREEYPRQRQTLQQALDANDMAQIHSAGHTVKGMCANLAMPQAAQAAARVEMAGKSQNAGDLAAAVADLDHAVARIWNQLDQNAGAPA